MPHDHKLRRAVLEELSWEPGVAADHIEVATAAGVVSLTGFVGTLAEKRFAEDATRRVKGVNAVASNLQVRLWPAAIRSDAEIATAAQNRLAWDVCIPRKAISLTVEHGWITLRGEVGWQYERAAAEDDLHRLCGVVGISNRITIKPNPQSSDLADQVALALERAIGCAPGSVKVTAHDGKIRLTGTVRCRREWYLAQSTAWAAPGAATVENELTIGR